MKRHLISGALFFAVVASAAFQLALLMVASRTGGSATVGAVSLQLAVANFLCAVGLSDLKSLSIRRLVEDQSLQPLTGLRNLCLASLAIIAMAGTFLPDSEFLTELIIIRASAQAADVNVSVWQKHRRTLPLFAFGAFRYVGTGALLFAISEITGRFDIALGVVAAATAVTTLIEQEVLRRTYPHTHLSWKPGIDLRLPDRNILIAGYASLSLAAGLNFLPQVVLRYQLLQFGSLETLGDFSVQYQISILAIPLITVLSQQALMRPQLTRSDVLRDEIVVGVTSALLMSATIALFLTPTSGIVKILFKSWAPLEFVSTIMVATSAVFLCMSVYLGFMTVALNRMFAQTVTGLGFLFILTVAGFGLGALFGAIGVLVGFAGAALARFVILQGIVYRASI